MSDLIDRQGAIDAISSMFAPTPTQKDMVEDCLEIIENLPSAQLENARINARKTHACDLIDRQAAIDGFYEMASDTDHLCTVSDYVHFLETMTSAQPKRKKEKGEWLDDCTCSICHWIHEDDNGFALITKYNFCPNCGEKMRGEQDDESRSNSNAQTDTRARGMGTTDKSSGI